MHNQARAECKDYFITWVKPSSDVAWSGIPAVFLRNTLFSITFHHGKQLNSWNIILATGNQAYNKQLNENLPEMLES